MRAKSLIEILGVFHAELAGEEMREPGRGHEIKTTNTAQLGTGERIGPDHENGGGLPRLEHRDRRFS